MDDTKLILPIRDMTSPAVIHETASWLAIYKPPGLVVESNPHEPSLADWVEIHLNKTSRKSFVGVIHRLDRMTSGIILFAKKKWSLKIFNQAFSKRLVQKDYLCLLSESPEIRQGRLTHWLQKINGQFKVEISPRPRAGYQECILDYSVLGEAGNYTVADIRLGTGRYHQIRAQFSQIGFPLVGDIIYGSRLTLPANRIALHAYRLSFEEPETNQKLTLFCPPNKDEVWPELTDYLYNLV